MTLVWQHVVFQLAFYPWLVWSHEFYHLKSIKIFEAPERLRKDSYFGYSVTYDEVNKRLIASAPRADNTGRIYSCDIEQRINCTTVPIPNITRDYKDYDHDYWLGATVAGGPSFYVTCAPRHVRRSPAYGDPSELATCYKSRDDDDSLTTIPTLTRHDKEPFDGLENEMDSFGWSITVSDSSSIFIGGPAMNTGRAMVYKNEFTLPVPIKANNTYNFGYSVAFGHFIYNKVLSYAVGSTYGSYGEGSVTIYQKTTDDGVKLIKGRDDNMVGTMFGAVLCSAKMSTKKDAIIVGAPTYAQDMTYDIGAVYVYLPNYQRPQFKRIIIGFQSGSFFGNAIASTGDLNGDKNDEVAIAAPYEDNGRGAIYLYCGAKIQSNEREITWLQKIQPKEFGLLSTFGLSLSALRDYDENGCNELAIGAPGVDRVAVLHCMAAVTVKLRAKFPNLQERKNTIITPLYMNETFANFKSCLDVTYPAKPKEIQGRINIRVELSHSSATLYNSIDGSLSYDVLLHTKKKEYCELIGLQLPKAGHYNMKIQYKISATLLENPVDSEEFQASKVILSDTSELSTSGSIWAAECERANACEPKLNLTLKFGESNIYKYMIGSTDQESISITIKNDGEPAYSSCITVRTEGLPIRSLPATNCVRVAGETNLIKCEPQIALNTGKDWNTEDIELDTKHLTSLDKDFVIYTELYDYCDMANKSVTKYTTVFELEKESSGIIVSGSTQNYEENIVSITKIELSNAKQIEQRYTFINQGFTNWKQVRCDVKLKKSPYINFSNNTFSIKDGTCSILADSEEYWRAECTINKIFKKFENNIYIFIDLINSDDLVQVLQKENYTIESSVTVYLDEREIKKSILSTLTLQTIAVPIWVIICAIIVGLMILMLIGLILRELGFLQRKNQKKLESLRQSVRRQTIRRSMMKVERDRIVSQACEAIEENSNFESLNNTNPEDIRRNLENKIMEEIRAKNMTK